MANIDHMFDKVKPGRTRTFDTGYGFIEVKGDDSNDSDSSKDTSDEDN